MQNKVEFIRRVQSYTISMCQLPTWLSGAVQYEKSLYSWCSLIFFLGYTTSAKDLPRDVFLDGTYLYRVHIPDWVATYIFR